MAAGKINLQANDGAVIGLVVPDGLTSGERQIALGTNLSSVASYHLLQGNLSVSNSTITKGFDTTLYTGNGSTQSINTGIDMDTQWGNTAEERFGGLVWGKSRSIIKDNVLADTVRGINNLVYSNATSSQDTTVGTVTSFNNNGFSVGSNAFPNTNLATYASWNFQTTHRVTGTTNHGKAYECHYNPFTGFTIVKYEGSGIAGHEIPHHLGRKLGFVVTKHLNAAVAWIASYRENYRMFLNTTDAEGALANVLSNINDNSNTVGSDTAVNQASNQYIMYGWANSYFDESNKLIGNYELVTYQGTGVAGNKVKTKGKPAWVMIKRIDSTGNWSIHDNLRLSDFDGVLQSNTSIAELNNERVDSVSDGFIITADNTMTDYNASGGQYIALVAYDTNSNGGGSYYPLASDTANVQVNNALIPLAKGIDANGVKNSIVVSNETITGVTYTAGKNYLYKTDSGYGVKPYKPRYLKSELVRRFAGEQPDYFDVESNKWFNCDAGTELVTNGKFDVNTTGWTGYSYSGSVFISDATVLTAISGLGTVTVASGKTYPAMEQALTTVVGKKYKLKFNRAITTGTFTACIATQSILGTNAMNSGALFYFDSTTTGDYEFEFVATQTTYYLRGGCSSVTVGQYSKFDGFTSFPMEITPTTELTESRNYMNHIVHADNDGGVLYVEELPKIEYKDIIKANEFKGKNACTAWVLVDFTATPPTIKDSYNISGVIRTSTGNGRIYFATEMDDTNFEWSYGATAGSGYLAMEKAGTRNTKYFDVITFEVGGVNGNNSLLSLNFYGGKN